MEIVIIGSGNAAAVLGRKFKVAGHTIKQVLSRNAEEGSKLALEWGTENMTDQSQLAKNADVYIIAVSDDSVSKVAEGISLPGKVVAHTAASVSKEVLKNVSPHYGIFYPLQSLRKEVQELPEIPVLIDASDEKARQVLESLARSIAADKVVVADDEQRQKMHVAAVVVNNFSNYLYQLAESYCRQEQLDFSLLLPLIKESADRLESGSPSELQTGPAARKDDVTIQKHLDLLKEHPQLQKVYQFLTEAILSTGKYR